MFIIWNQVVYNGISLELISAPKALMNPWFGTFKLLVKYSNGVELEFARKPQVNTYAIVMHQLWVNILEIGHIFAIVVLVISNKVTA